MTWMAFDGDEPIVGVESENDPGEVMLSLMKIAPEEIGWDYVKWLNMRDRRMENAVRALFDPAVAGKLKEEYLEFVSIYTKDVGYFRVLYSDITIKWFDTEGEE